MAHENLVQVRILQISDIHFGTHFISKPEHPDYSPKGFPSLAKLVADDLNSEYWHAHPWASGKCKDAKAPLIIAATGDFTQTANRDEFDCAYNFLEELANLDMFGEKVGLENTYLVPGNHDVIFEERKPAHRFESFCSFYNRVFSKPQNEGRRPFARPEEIGDLTRIHKVEESKLIVAEINCCHYVEKDTVDQSRGQVDVGCIASLRSQLEKSNSDGYLKIAILHHHPILIPSFIEPGRGVDAIANAKALLRLLREYGFHAILHGHKHYPHVFTYDPEPAWSDAAPLAQLVVAGGSLGSRELPQMPGSSNTYNLMTLKWDPSSKLARAVVVTRGLQRNGSDGVLDPDQWRWQTLRVYDRVLSNFENTPKPNEGIVQNFPKTPDNLESERIRSYANQRGNMPVIEVVPSTLPGQGYEGRVWLVQHNKKGSPPAEVPAKVTWSAGGHFPRKTIDSTGSPRFCTSFNYWGSTLVQAIMEFQDGQIATACVYARVPEI